MYLRRLISLVFFLIFNNTFLFTVDLTFIVVLICLIEHKKAINFKFVYVHHPI